MNRKEKRFFLKFKTNFPRNYRQDFITIVSINKFVIVNRSSVLILSIWLHASNTYKAEIAKKKQMAMILRNLFISFLKNFQLPMDLINHGVSQKRTTCRTILNQF